MLKTESWILIVTILLVAAQPAEAHNIDLNQVSGTAVSAIVVPNESEIGTTSNVWLGAVFNGQLYLRDGGSNWQLFTGSYRFDWAEESRLR